MEHRYWAADDLINYAREMIYYTVSNFTGFAFDLTVLAAELFYELVAQLKAGYWLFVLAYWILFRLFLLICRRLL